MPRTTPLALRVAALAACSLVAACGLFACSDDPGAETEENDDGAGTSGGGASGSTGSGSGGSSGEGGSTGVGGEGGGGSDACGNMACDAGETCASCPGDCGACPMCDGAGPETTGLDAEEQSFLEILNGYRAQNGLGPLSACTSLARAAQGHSEDMRDQNYFSHDSLDGRSPWDRACNACYELGCTGTAMAENIAAGSPGAEGTFTQWQESPGHNANMLGDAFAVIGIGRATGGGTYGAYWTTVFGGSTEPSCD